MAALVFLASVPAFAQDAEPPMTLNRMGSILLAVDPDAKVSGNAVEMTIEGIPVIVIADARADRMRAMVPIRSAEGMSQAELLREEIKR